ILKYGPVDAAAGRECKAVGGICLVADVAAWKKLAVISRKCGIFLNGITQLVSLITRMLISYSGLYRQLSVFLFERAVHCVDILFINKMIALGVIVHPLSAKQVLVS